jgi:hypothetical protein
METMAGSLIPILVAVALLITGARLVRLDGYGHRPAPRGTDDWSVDGLPSRPYGC